MEDRLEDCSSPIYLNSEWLLSLTDSEMSGSLQLEVCQIY